MELPIEEKNKRRITFKPWDRARDKKFLKSIAILAVIFAALIIIKDEFVWQINSLSSTEENQTEISTDQDVEKNGCNIQGIELHGDIVTYISPADLDEEGNIIVDQTASENISYAIEQAEKDDKIKAILLEIDSYGGSPVAAEEIANALKQAKKPTVALIREGGVSGAYLSATGADIIFASKNSDVGGIGVTMSYLDSSKKNQEQGLTYNRLSSGKFKDTGDPDKELSAEEIKLLMRDVNIVYQNFVKAVAENRGLDIEKVRKLADGSTMMGEMALRNGLIDQIGGVFEVKEYLKEKIGEDAEVCW